VALPPQVVGIGAHTRTEAAFFTPRDANQHHGRAGTDGLLPTALFRKVFISYVGRFVMFDPR
jgi:hypothetical protein